MLLNAKNAALTMAICPNCDTPEGIYPKFRQPVIPAEVPEKIARDYKEAALVASVSRRAAAALGRRALQAGLRAKNFRVPSNTLRDEIEEACQSPDTPSTLREKLHFIRDVGNDAAHPNLDYQGAFVEVEQQDLDLLFEALHEFFDVFFVRPVRHAAIMKARKQRKAGP